MSAPLLPDLIAARAGLAGVTPSSSEIDQLIAYYTLLERWNQKINLTALPLAAREPNTIDRLLVEPLVAANFVEDQVLSWFDFGSGGGSPAIPLKVVRPRASLIMVEAKARKGAFLREAVSSLGLPNAAVMTGRIEDLVTLTSAGTVDLITVRAVRIDAEVLTTARNLLKVHGTLLLFRGAESETSVPAGFDAIGTRRLHPSSGILSAFQRGSS